MLCPRHTTARCTACGAEYPVDTPMNLCPTDDKPVVMVLDTDHVRRACPDRSWYRPEINNMWRFGPLLPFDITDADERPQIVSLGEGFTPELEFSDHNLAQRADFRLRLKDEGKAHTGFGANPSQSFKDRGMSMTATMARALGIMRLAVPTQGNAGDSLAVYGQAAGLGVVVAMPEETPQPIMANVALLSNQHDDIRLVTVRGTIREAGELLKREWIPQGWFNAATFQEPGWRIEGKKTLGLEVAEPKASGEPWRLPDVVIYPTGGGTGILGMWKAFDELEALGVIDARRPRMVCVQNTATAPLVEAFHRGDDDTTVVEAGETLAFGVNVPGGVGHFRVLEIIRESGGMAVAVEEADMLEALSSVWREKRWWICPEGAACIAAIPALLDCGMIRQGDEVVVFNTGSLEKYLPNLRHLL